MKKKKLNKPYIFSYIIVIFLFPLDLESIKELQLGKKSQHFENLG